MNGVLVKVSEIWLKGKNRKSFIEQLITNISSVTGIDRSKIKLVRSRIYINDQNVRDLDKVFGIHSFVPTITLDDDIEKIKKVAVRLMHEKKGDARTFAICSRKEHGYPLSTTQINEVVGQAVNDASGGIDVDLDNPDITINVEIRDKKVFIYTSKDEIRGQGGLPVGMTGTGLALLSGGIDSPVGAWIGMKRGLSVDGVYFHSAPYTSRKALEKVIDHCRVLSRWNGKEMKLYSPSFGEIQKCITDTAPEQYWTILFRRSMRRIAEMIARHQKYQLLISGDNLAQVASQTAENLAVSDKGMDFLMIRPVIGYDKQEIIDKAHIIGTYHISIQPFVDCCNVFTPRKPKTKSRIGDIERIEKRLQLQDLEKNSFEQREQYMISSGKVT